MAVIKLKVPKELQKGQVWAAAKEQTETRRDREGFAAAVEKAYGRKAKENRE